MNFTKGNEHRTNLVKKKKNGDLSGHFYCILHTSCRMCMELLKSVTQLSYENLSPVPFRMTLLSKI